MAQENTLSTRICVRYDTETNWNNSSVSGKGANLVLLSGEMGICYTPSTSSSGTPIVRAKVGDGSTTFANLPWLSGKSDGYEYNIVVNNDSHNKPVSFTLKRKAADSSTWEDVTTFNYEAATESSSGLMSASDKAKLNNTIEVEASEIEIPENVEIQDNKITSWSSYSGDDEQYPTAKLVSALRNPITVTATELPDNLESTDNKITDWTEYEEGDTQYPTAKLVSALKDTIAVTAETITATDEKVKQSVSTDNVELPLLAKINTGTAEVVDAVKFSEDVTLNPSTGNLTVSSINGVEINGTVTVEAQEIASNTAGATNTSDKIFLVGAPTQGEAPQTYSQEKVYASGGYLYSNNTQVLTSHQDISGKEDKDNKISSWSNYDPTSTEQYPTASLVSPLRNTLEVSAEELPENLESTDNKLTSWTNYNDDDVQYPTAKLVSSLRNTIEVTAEEIVSTDEKVKQSPSTENAELPLLAKNGSGVTETTDASKFSKNVTLNPSSGNLTVGSINGVEINGTVTVEAQEIATSDTWRNIKVNGTEILGTATTTGALNLANGTNTTVSNESGTVKINSTDTKNTAGATNTTDKIFLVGAKSQVDGQQTYSQSGVYVDNQGSLYSNSKAVLTSHQDISSKEDTTNKINSWDDYVGGSATQYPTATLVSPLRNTLTVEATELPDPENMETTTNKISAWGSDDTKLTNTMYPGAKLVKDSLNNKASTDLATTSTPGLMSATDKSKIDNAITATAQELATVAISGSYNDLSDKPTIPTLDNAVTHDKDTQVGASNKPVYVTSDGKATAISYEINKTVPQDAKFTDTTYEEATTSTAGLMSATDKSKIENAITATATTLSKSDVGLSNVENKSPTEILSGMTKSNVTTALGYTPYDSANPSGYTANKGTVTSVSVKINGETKGTVTESGTIDLGTVSRTDEKVKQSPSTDSSGAYPVLTKTSTSATEETNTANFSSKVSIVPGTGNLKAIYLNGSEIGSTPKFTDHNQKIKVGSTTFEADSEVSLAAGSNIGLTTGTNSVTIGVTNTLEATAQALTKSDVGLDKVGNFKAVSTEASQGLTDTEKANARTNIGAGTGTYVKPDTGIPKTDLASAVQDSLGKADTALQEHQSLAAYRTSAAQDVIDGTKVDKVEGKGLSTNDYTTTEKTKLAGIAAGAEVNVQSNWTETDTTSDAYILNKPSTVTATTVDTVVTRSSSSGAVGSTTKPVYINSSGVATGIGYTIESNVPSGAVFTDTNQTIKGNGTAFNSDAVVDIKPGSNISISTDTTNNTITITSTAAGTDEKVKQSPSSANGSYPLLAKASTRTTETTDTSVFNSKVTVNPSTGNVAATTFTGNLSGNATTATSATSATKATQDGSGNVITSTYATKAVATTSANGLMSSTDKSKLENTITATATELATVATTGSYNDLSDKPTIPTYSAGTGLSLSGTEFNHSNSVTAGTAGTTSKQEPAYGSTFNIPYVTYDAQGHVTVAGTSTVKIPDSVNTDTKVTQTVSTDNADLPLLAKASSGTTTVTETSKFAAAVTINPSTGNLKTTQINGVAVTSSPKFTDHITTATTSGTGNAVTAVTADSSGNLTVTKGATYASTAVATTSTNGLMSSTDKSKIDNAITATASALESSDVTTALGYTPYDSANPSGYTANKGTVTSVAVKINGETKGTITTSGTIDLGTVSGTDTKVTQTVSTDNADLPILAKTSNSTSTVTDGSKFAAAITLNPSTGNLKATQLNGVAIGSSPKFTDTVTTVVNGTTSGNAVTSITASNGVLTVNKGTTFLTSHQDISGKENTSNKVTSWSSTTTDTHYPSEKLVKTSLDGKVDKTTAGVSVALNLLSTGTSTPVDADYYISQSVGGGTTTTTYHRRPMSALWAYIKGKIGVSKGSSTQPIYIDSNGAAQACTYSLNKTVPSDAVFTDTNTTYTFATGDSNGTFKVTPSGGTASSVSIKGLGSAAYTDSTAYATAAQGTNADSAAASIANAVTVTSSALEASDIPSLDASKITSGTFADARIASASTWNGKQSALTVNPSSTTATLSGLTINGTAYAVKDTTYSSKSAASGGTDVSLVTTGEKYTWNSKGSGTVTSVAVKMNGSTKGTITTSGTIDLGTVITTHQDISGKQDASTAVTHTASTAAGSATQPIYVNSSGVATATTYALNATVPSNAVFTDTKNTAGSTDTSSKIFLVGATSQTANPQTYSHDTAYVGTDGCLYSGSAKVLTAHQDISGKANVSETGYSLSVSGTSLSLKNKAGTALSTVTTQDTNTTYTFASGSTNGAFSVTPSGGTAQSVAIKGLGSAAYTASTAYATAAQGTNADSAYTSVSNAITATATTLATVATSGSYSDLSSTPTDLPVTYTTTAPTAAYTGGGLKIAVLTSEPSTKYDGWIYLIKKA